MISVIASSCRAASRRHMPFRDQMVVPDCRRSGGLEEILQERLKVLLRLPDYAAAVVRRPLTILPVALRSR